MSKKEVSGKLNWKKIYSSPEFKQKKSDSLQLVPAGAEEEFGITLCQPEAKRTTNRDDIAPTLEDELDDFEMKHL